MKRGLLLSLVAHALILLWVVTRPERAPVSKDASTELVLFEVAVQEPKDLPPEPAPPQAPPARPKLPRPAPPPQAAPERAEKPPPPQPEDAPVANVTAPLPSPNAPSTALSLFPKILDWDAGIQVEVSEQRGLRAPPVPKDLLGQTAKEALGRGRVARGLVHPYYVSLGKTLIKNWDADRSVSAKGLKGFFENAQENTRTWNKIWVDRASQFGGSGSPWNDSDTPRAPIRPQNPNLAGPAGDFTDVAARKELQRQMAQQFKATRRATIRVVQNLSGALTQVELVEPSNDEHVDKEALADVRAAAQKLPPPPPEAIEGKNELSSLWSFELVVSITPPVPTFTFEFDEVIGFVDARLPLDRRIYKRVKLISVE